MSRLRYLAAAAFVAVLLVPSAADAAVPAKAFKNCTALRAKYPNGVARTAAAAAAQKVKPAVNRKVYDANKKMDRDGDLVACEK